MHVIILLLSLSVCINSLQIYYPTPPPETIEYTLPPPPTTPVRPSPNIARGKPTYQSSFYNVIPASSDGSGRHAVDGILDASFFSGNPMFHVNDGAGGPNWLVVDLQGSYKVLHVTVYNRLDCCSEREDNLIIGLLSYFNPVKGVVRGSYPLCGTYPGSAQNKPILEIDCDANAPVSCYVVAQQPANGAGYLQFAEIEIYGTSAPAPILTCPPGWDAYPLGNRCFKIITEMKDWYVHSKTCNNLHTLSHLVKPSTSQDQKYVDDYLTSKKDILNQNCMNKSPSYLKIWTAGQRTNPSDTASPWMWKPFPSDSQPITYTNWLPGEPNNAYKEESCIHFKFGNSAFGWNDVACATNYNIDHMHAFYDNNVVAMCALCEINFS